MGVTQAKRQAAAVSDDRKRVIFRLEAPEARSVALAGTFNQWQPDATPLKKDQKGTWRAQLTLPRGRHEYRYVVDGEWRDDPRAGDYAPNPFGGLNSILQI